MARGMGAAMEKCVATAPPEEEEEEEAMNPDNPTATFIVDGGMTGEFTVEIFLDRVPLTASNFIDLAQSGFYNGLHFHRVMPKFMNQFGCPLSRNPNNKLAGTGGPPEGSVFKNLRTGESITRQNGCIADEFTSEDSNDVGTLSMANTGEPNTGGSQFFLNVADNEALNWFSDGPDRHPVFGRVIDGFKLVKQISRVPVIDDRMVDDADRRPLAPIKVITVSVANLPSP